MRVPVRVRLTAWYVLLLAATIVCFTVFLVVRERAALVGGVDSGLASRARQVALALGSGGEGQFADVGDVSVAGLAATRSATEVLSQAGEVLDSSGATVAERPMLTLAELRGVLRGHDLRVTRRLGATGEPFRLLAVPLPTRSGDRVLVVASPLDEVDRSIRQLVLLSLLTAPAVLVVAALGGWWLAGHALRPVVRMTAAAGRIGVDDLDRRVDVPPAADELRRLAETLNSMLDRVRRGVEDKRRFVADASHELRTPLAVMRSELDVELGSAHLSADARDVLRSALDEVERMGRMVENLLTLARIDDGRLALLCSRFDLAEAAARVLDRLRPVAAAGGVRLRLTGPATEAVADRDRIEQALTNLVDNAVKYGAGEVEVEVWQHAGRAGVTVRDTGPGIPAENLPHLFDRFYRVDGARSRAQGGTGLGLAICREIVEAHHGSIEATSTPGRGSVFSLALPVHTASQESLTVFSSASD
jgi:heavy metal sensor kinase